MTFNPLPLTIATVSFPGIDGLIGLSSCPGNRAESNYLDLYEELLMNDLLMIRKWGAVAIVTLLDSLEMGILGVNDLPNVADWLNLRWFNLPLQNRDLPDKQCEELWLTIGPQLCELLREGKRIVIHCKEGVGRSGLIAARLLIELGATPKQAISAVQKARPECLQLYSQEKYCYALAAE